MTRLGMMTVVIAAVAVLGQSAQAGPRQHRADPRIDAVGLGVGVASTVGFLALNGWHFGKGHATSALGTTGALVATTAGCVVVSPMVATVVVRRPLTYREAHVLAAGCVVPFIGPWLVNAAYDAHPEWAAFDAPAPRPHKRHRHRRRH
jgi:hypothetical protein